jgi:hypothetical protein
MNRPINTMLDPARDSRQADAREDLAAAIPEVTEFFSALDKAVRARRLYQANNPVFHQFVQAFHQAIITLFDKLPSLSVSVEEYVFRWQARDFSAGEGRDSVAFLFYKDGVRYLTFLPGFEEEADRFLNVMAAARLLDQRSDDDIVTLLWQNEFVNFRYTYVDALAEGLQIPESNSETATYLPAGTQISLVPEAGAEASEPQPMAVASGQLTVAQSFSRSDFAETLYFMEPAELERLRTEVELEMQRDIHGDVLNALFDRLEDPIVERQTEILRILRQVLPTFLATGQLRLATMVLVQLNGIVERSLLPPEQAATASDLFRELSEPAVLSQLLASLEDGTIDPTGPELGIFLAHLGPNAMPLLLRTIDRTGVPTLQERLRVAMQGLAERYSSHLLALLRLDAPEIVRGAVGLVVQMGRTDAIPALADILKHPDAGLRRVAVDGLARMKNASAFEALQRALDDSDRDVRIASARGLAGARYTPARARLEEVVKGKSMRDADLTEKIALFEAYGAVATADSVEMLDRMLNGKKMFSKESPELRACAAMALGKVGTPAARASLQKSFDDGNPMVRNAVAKALRQESQG